MPSIYRPRRPRASPLWQIFHHSRTTFQSQYETSHRKIHGPLRPDTVDVVNQLYRCGDRATGFTRILCPDCEHGRARPELESPNQPENKQIPQPTLFILPVPDTKSRSALRPLWRDLITKIWGEDPLICPCCKGEIKILETMIRREEVEFFLPPSWIMGGAYLSSPAP